MKEKYIGYLDLLVWDFALELTDLQKSRFILTRFLLHKFVRFFLSFSTRFFHF